MTIKINIPSFQNTERMDTEDEIESSPDWTPEQREAALWDKYEHLFWDHKGSAIGRSANDPPEVSTEWAPSEIHAARGYKKGDNPFPPNYVRAEKASMAALDEKALENVKANIECMSANGLTTAEISDVLRVLECDVLEELQAIPRSEVQELPH